MLEKQLQDYLKESVEDMGYVFWGVETDKGAKQSDPVLRIYIDHEEGISLEDCQEVSNELSGILDVENLISSKYVLEVSSPGIDRKIFTLEQAEHMVGFKFKVKAFSTLQTSQFKGRKFKGKLNAVKEDILYFDSHGEIIELSFSNVDKMRVIPEW